VLFNSFSFGLFLLIVLLGNIALRPLQLTNLWLFCCSIFFYGFVDWRLLTLILLCAADGYFVGLLITRYARYARLLIRVGIALPLVVLCLFKYFNFFVQEFGLLSELIGLGRPELALSLALPIGVSFYTFQTISYLVDVYRGCLSAERNVIDFGLFITFFPQLVAGPIERGDNLLAQIKQRQNPTGEDLLAGLYLLAQGYAKKLLVADNIKPTVDIIFGLQDPSGPLIFVATLGFALQIYCDFSGYSDIARGIARILGFRLLLNFSRPYWSCDPASFWSRWHITLSSWFRDYVYIPLGGNRLAPARTYVNLMATMTLSGLWHGASVNFVLWGGFHGLVLVFHRALRSVRPSPRPRLIGWAATMSTVLFGWLIFRVTDGVELRGAISALLTDFRYGGLAVIMLGSIAPFILALFAIDYAESKLVSADGNELSPTWHVTPVILVLTSFTILFGADSSGAFIYFQF